MKAKEIEWKSVFVDKKGKFKNNRAVKIMNKLCATIKDYGLIYDLIEIAYNKGREDQLNKEKK